MKNRLLLFGLLLVFFSSCYEEVEYGNIIPPSRLVVHSFINADSTVRAEVSNSWNVLEEGKKELPEHARVALYINDTFKEYLIKGKPSDIHLRYYSDTRPAVGDRVRLEVKADGYEPVKGESQIPERPGFLRAIGIREKAVEGYRLKFHITLKDDLKRKNYYALKVVENAYINTGSGEWEEAYFTMPVELDCSEDKILDQNRNILEDLFLDTPNVRGALYPFADGQIDGLEYTLKVSISLEPRFWPQYDNDPTVMRHPKKYTIGLISLSESYYRYLSSLIGQDIEDFSSIGLADPALTYNNVEKGIGVIGSCYLDTLQVTMDAVIANER